VTAPGPRRTAPWLLVALLLLATACADGSTLPRLLDEEAPLTLPEAAPDNDFCEAEEAPPAVLRFGVTPYLDEALLREHFEPVLAHLAQETGYTFELVPGESYAALVDQLARKEVDIASLSPLTYVKARENMPCLKLLLTQVAFGSVSYSGYLVVRADSRITTVEDLRGRRFAFTDRDSASGYLYPQAFLLERGIRAEDFFGQVVFAGDHLNSLKMVLNGEVDAAATFSSFMRPARAMKLDVAHLRVLAVTGSIPHDAVVARPGLAPEVAAAVMTSLAALNTSTDGGRKVLSSDIEANGWVATREWVYDSVRNKLRRLREADK
jgi:phosphate/phosphite/phosphonate ABC transporter binding protein